MATQKKKTPTDWEAVWTEYEQKQHQYEVLGLELKRLKRRLAGASMHKRPPIQGPARNNSWEDFLKMHEHEANHDQLMKEWKLQQEAKDMKRKLRQELERQIEKTVYREMSQKTHPDHGGNHEDMVMLNDMYRRKRI